MACDASPRRSYSFVGLTGIADATAGRRILRHPPPGGAANGGGSHTVMHGGLALVRGGLGDSATPGRLRAGSGLASGAADYQWALRVSTMAPKPAPSVEVGSRRDAHSFRLLIMILRWSDAVSWQVEVCLSGVELNEVRPCGCMCAK